MRLPTVERVETFPLEVTLPYAYGTAKALGDVRFSTLVKLTATDGTTGWGESYGPPAATAPFLARAAEHLLGVPLGPRENHALNTMQRDYHVARSGLAVAAASGLDIAMWDAFGHATGRSVAEQLGGRVRDDAHAYASTGYFGPDLRDQLDRARDEGFDAVKIKIGVSLRDDVARTALAREIVGDEGQVMVDFNGNATRDTAAATLRAIADTYPSWAEEPLSPANTSGWQELRAIGVPLAAGEALYGRFEFRDPIADGRLDVVQPDVAKCGGLSEARAVVTLASAWDLRVSPHCWGGGLAQAATLQLIASIPETPFGRAVRPVMFEFDRSPNPLREDVLVEPISQRGSHVAIPAGPGLGVTVDEERVRSMVPGHLRSQALSRS